MRGMKGELLSDYLNNTNNEIEGEERWFTWIFSGDNNNKMIASSDHQITVPIAEIEGCIQAQETAGEDVVQWVANEHPNPIMQIISDEIIQFYPSLNDLPINTTSVPEQIKLPLDLPDALSGRFLTYPYSNKSADISLNWIVTKSIDISNFESKENDDIKIISFILFCLTFCVYVIQGNLTISSIKDDTNNYDKIDETEDMIAADASATSINNLSASRRNNNIGMQQIKEEQQRANDKYAELLTEMVNIVEGSSAEVWHIFLTSFRNKIGIFPTSTSMVRDFMAKESNKHIETDEKDDLTLILCALQIEHKWYLFRVLKFIKSYGYNTFITLIIFLHMYFMLFLPETPTKLNNDGFNETNSQFAFGFSLFAIIIEIIDLFFHGFSRYIVFGQIEHDSLIHLMKLKHGFNHKFVSQVENKSISWLIFFGTNHFRLFLIHLTLVFLIFINLIAMASLRVGLFEYYIPLVPILLVVRSEDIRLFSYQFFSAVYLAKDVLFSYGVLMLLVAILGLSVFSEILNPESSTDTYHSSIRALIEG